ncbi:MAG: winged helix-turn-helix transcriptional regulator, partial [Candidatus Thalassarchaeaceae archaeon]
EPVEEPAEEPVEEPAEEPVEGPEEIVEDVLSNDLVTDGNDNTAQTNLENPTSKNTVIIGFVMLFVMVSVLLGTASLKGKKNQRINLGSTDVISTDKANELFQLLSRSKMVQILNILHSEDHPIRFTELKNRLDTSSTTLTRRLGELEDYDLVKRTVNDTVPATVAYELTNYGVSLLPSLDSFFDWVESQ